MQQHNNTSNNSGYKSHFKSLNVLLNDNGIEGIEVNDIEIIDPQPVSLLDVYTDYANGTITSLNMVQISILQAIDSNADIILDQEVRSFLETAFNMAADIKNTTKR